jgi:hypothetical protein
MRDSVSVTYVSGAFIYETEHCKNRGNSPQSFDVSIDKKKRKEKKKKMAHAFFNMFFRFLLTKRKLEKEFFILFCT